MSKSSPSKAYSQRIFPDQYNALLDPGNSFVIRTMNGLAVFQFGIGIFVRIKPALIVLSIQRKRQSFKKGLPAMPLLRVGTYRTFITKEKQQHNNGRHQGQLSHAASAL